MKQNAYSMRIKGALVHIFLVGAFLLCIYTIASLRSGRAIGPYRLLPGFVRYAAKMPHSRVCPDVIPVYEARLKIDPRDYDALWRLSSCYNEMGILEEAEAASREYLKKGIDYASRAVEINEGGCEGHLYLAEGLGVLLQYEGPIDRVRLVREVRREAERAATLEPSHYRTYLILGIWHRKVVGANWFEKMLAKNFLGGLPDASLEEAERLLKRSVELKPDFPKTHYELGHLYLTMGKKDQAMAEFRKVLACPIANKKDEELKEESLRLLGEEYGEEENSDSG